MASTTCEESEEDGKRASGATTHETNEVQRGRDDEGNTYVNQYVVTRSLGRGSFGKVKLCCDTTTKRVYALKIVKRGTGRRAAEMMSSLAMEIAIMKKLARPTSCASSR